MTTDPLPTPPTGISDGCLTIAIACGLTLAVFAMAVVFLG